MSLTVNILLNPVKHIYMLPERAVINIKHDLPASRDVRYFLCHVGCAQQQPCVNFQEGKKNTQTFHGDSDNKRRKVFDVARHLSFRQNKSPISCEKPAM